MALGIGCFITITRPRERGDMYKQCLEMANQCFDIVTIIDGEKTWPRDFNWPTIGHHFQKGYEQCEADWVVHLDCDFIFNEKDYQNIRQACEANNDAPALSFWKWQFVLPDRYNLKSRVVLAVNKAKFGDRIKFNAGGDLCQPSLDGKYLAPGDVPEARVGFYNYEKLLKTAEQIQDDCGRMERAYFRHFGEYQMGKSGSDMDAYLGWLEMTRGRFNKPQQHIKLSEHPQVMQDTIKNLKPTQWGYSGFGLLEKNDYIKEPIK